MRKTHVVQGLFCMYYLFFSLQFLFFDSFERGRDRFISLCFHNSFMLCVTNSVMCLHNVYHSFFEHNL